MTTDTPPCPDENPSADLVRRAKEGDRTALEALIQNSQDRLKNLVRARMGPEIRLTEESMDVVQSSLREAVRDLSDFEYRGKGSFERWLATIAEHKLRHLARFHRRQKRDPDLAVPLDARDGMPDSPTAGCPTPSEVVSAGEAAEQVRRALEQLGDDERDLIVWRLFDELTCKQVAHLLDTTEAAASKRYLRALQRLQGLLS